MSRRHSLCLEWLRTVRLFNACRTSFFTPSASFCIFRTPNATDFTAPTCFVYQNSGSGLFVRVASHLHSVQLLVPLRAFFRACSSIMVTSMICHLIMLSAKRDDTRCAFWCVRFYSVGRLVIIGGGWGCGRVSARPRTKNFVRRLRAHATKILIGQ
jgi:hypothetical protein